MNKKNILYHPLAKGLCLILCLASILGFAFTGLRCLFMDSVGIMANPPQFYIPYRLYYEDETLYWPQEHAWYEYGMVFQESNGMAYVSGDLLRDAVNETLAKDEFAFLYDDAYMSAVIAASQNADVSMPETEYADADAASHTEMPFGIQYIINGDDVYPACASAELLSFFGRFSSGHSNFRFCVRLNGMPIISNMGMQADTSTLLSPKTYENLSIENSIGVLSIDFGIAKNLPYEDAYAEYYIAWMTDASDWEPWIVWTAVLAVSSFLFLLLLFVQTGMRWKEPGVVHLSVIDRIPAELVFGGVIFIGFSLLFVIVEFGHIWLNVKSLMMLFGYATGTSRDWLMPILWIGLCIVFVCLVLWVLCSLIRRIRAGECWKNTLVFFICRFLYQQLRRILRGILLILSNIALLWKWLVGCAVFGLWSLLVIAARDGFLTVLWFISSLALGLGGCFLMLQMDKVIRGAQKIASGDLNHHIETKKLVGAPRTLAGYLNSIGCAMQIAVEERMKSERFRTELITNVSHDLKTPLTSIINYTDLLAGEECENETMKGYIEVLTRQAARLKKLTEDLLEASKASTGTLAVNLVPTDAAELLNQAVGEYEERFSAADLHIVLSIEEPSMMIRADGKHLWRVFDNLLGNICKYSMRGTRVYLNAARQNESIVISFRNISDTPISISTAELTERFVRGDVSRHTEGSGLGLAIADSLCKLQGGELLLTVDGDLFKAVVRFPAFSEKA